MSKEGNHDFLRIHHSSIDTNGTNRKFCYKILMKATPLTDLYEILQKLPNQRINEVRDFVSFLWEKERRKKAFANRVTEAEKGPFIDCCSVEKVMEAIQI